MGAVQITHWGCLLGNGVGDILGEGGKGSRGLCPWGSTLPICPQAQEVPGVKIFRSSSTLYFANVELYAEALKKKVGELPAPLVLPVPPACWHQGGSGAPRDMEQHYFAEWHQRGPPDREEEEGPQEAEETAEESREGEGKEEKGASLPWGTSPVPAHTVSLPGPCPPARAFAGLGGPGGPPIFWGHWVRRGTGAEPDHGITPKVVGGSQDVNH